MTAVHVPDVMALEDILFGAERWTLAMLREELDLVDSRYYVVAVVDEQIVGYAGLAAFDDEAFVQTIGVHPDFQGAGIGAALLDDLLAEADRRGAATVLLEVRTDNEIARRLYDRRGFRPLRVRRGYYRRSGADALEMQRG
ncbi:MAG: ribosomal protein S18-alanine N-acetyltransferase [Mycobacteriales bacterium]